MTNSEAAGDEARSEASAGDSREDTARPGHAIPAADDGSAAGGGSSIEDTLAAWDAAAGITTAAPDAAADSAPAGGPAEAGAATAAGDAAEDTGTAVSADPPAATEDTGAAEPADSEADTEPAGRGRFSWRSVVGATAALVVIAGGMTAYFVAGAAHPGPLTIATVDSTGTIPRERPAMVVIPVTAARSAAVVIDDVELRGGDQRRAPVPTSILGDRDASCSGVWWPLGGAGSFSRRCAPGGTVTLIGQPVPLGNAASDIGPASKSVRTIDVAIEVAAPGAGHCWTVGRITIDYHVGTHHYSTAAAESIAACAGLTDETPTGPVAADG